MTLVVHAPNIHLGGGRTLLLALLPALDQPAVVQLDERFGPLPELAPGVRVIRVAPSAFARLQAELRLLVLCRSGDTLLSFGNLPPLFQGRGRTFVYLQNRYLTSACSLKGLPRLVRLRICIERFWLRHFLRDATPLVQTETMMLEVMEHLGREAKLMPFLSSAELPQNEPPSVLYDYLFVASGEPHKNHRRLIDAWVLLANRGFFPSLCLTLDPNRDRELIVWIEDLAREYRLRIINNPLPPNQIFLLYMKCGALIYPSLFESFGLPLLEARQANLPIVAAERDYVRDVIAPVVSFDPESAISIARAVMRHQGLDRAPSMPGNATDFLEKLAELA